MENRRKTAILIMVLAIVFYIAAIISFFAGSNMTVLLIIFGTGMVSLGAATAIKVKKESEEASEKENEQD